MTGQEVLAIELGPNSAEAGTVREYLGGLLLELWMNGEGFSGKRPFGDSGWERELYDPVEEAGAENPYEAIKLAIKAMMEDPFA